ncbi:hypothetical protein BASA81_018539 [Batrachochytrium salamandrivorans]|nr:hypothetical protein BASA81_018539 [Batrachochytrium salamandrivorans]
MMYALDCRTVFLHVSQAMPGHARLDQVRQHSYNAVVSEVEDNSSTPVSITTEAITITTSTATTITTTTMSIFSDILPTIVIPLAIGAFSYVSSWWYREAGHLEPDTCFELPLGPSWYISGLEVYQPYFQPVPMPSSSFPVREVDERIRDLPMRSEMQAHSHRAMVNVPSPVCNKLSTAKMQPIRSGFGLNHHLVSRLARESPQMGGRRQVPGPNPFLASTHQRIPVLQYVPIRRAVVYLPPPAVHSLPPPALPPPGLPTWTPEILAPTVVEPVQPLGVTVSHTPDRHPTKISRGLKRKLEESDMMSPARPSKIRRIQEMSNLGCVMKWGSGGGFARKLCEIRKLAKIRRSRRLKFGGPPATPRRGAAMRMPLRDYTRGNQIRPDLLLTPSDIPYIGPLLLSGTLPWLPWEYLQHQKYMVMFHHTSLPHHVRLRMSHVKTWIYLQSGLKLNPNTCLKWDGDCSDPKEPTSPMGLSSPNRENGRESPLAPSSDLPRQSISVEKLWRVQESVGDSEKELEYLWGGSDGSVGGSGESTSGIPETPPDNLFRIRTPEISKGWGNGYGNIGSLEERRYDTKPDIKELRVQGVWVLPKEPCIKSHIVLVV